MKRKKELEREMKEKLPRYVGESSRSAYERGFEHLNSLASLSNKSIMLRHMLTDHEGKDMSEIKWGMFVTSFKRTAFERQLEEAVVIEREAKTNPNILNSKSEWQNSALPRLVTRKGNMEEELKNIENEIKKDKDKDEEFEIKLRNLRKQRNKLG